MAAGICSRRRGLRRSKELSGIFPTRTQWKSWSKPTKYEFIGLIVAILALFNIPAIVIQSISHRRVDSYENQRRYFVVRLAEANTCLTARLYFDGLHDLSSDCKIDLDGLTDFSHRYAGYIAITPYSGAWNLEDYARNVEITANHINKANSRAHLKAIQKGTGSNFAKTGYYICGIEWYLRHSPPENLPEMSKTRVRSYQDGWLSWLAQNGGNFGNVSFKHDEFKVFDDPDCGSFIDLLD